MNMEPLSGQESELWKIYQEHGCNEERTAQELGIMKSHVSRIVLRIEKKLGLSK